MALKPWYKIVTPRDDLKEGRPLDAAEFAVNLDLVRNGQASEDYLDPKQFFKRTYLTENLTGLAAEVIRRLSGERTQTSAVFNLATQFGGGKTHSLTLLYHLAKEGPAANNLPGVMTILNRAEIDTVPCAAIAIFDGKEFDSLSGRGGDDGTPLRKTPWGEIAFQLGGEKALKILKEHEEKLTAPSGDVIRKFLPKDTPSLILMDELMNYVTRTRKSGLADQFYAFLHNLSEAARGMDRVVLVVSVPASELEMTPSDQEDYDRIKKLLDRVGKPVQISHEKETAEIIRRRLFEWEGVPNEANKIIQEYADWVVEHRQQVPSWFPVDRAREEFKASYPFHPLVISVFERKWRALPRFQQTRGVLRMLALWVSQAYREGYLGKHKDTLIGIGSAPLDESLFRAAVFEQLGESRLEAAVTTDICGKSDSNATRLDAEATEPIRKARLHRKVATTIFFESNGGQARTAEATLSEIRLAVGEPDLDIGNIETVLEALAPPNGACFYLDVSKNRYWFSMKPNLSKVLADRKASVDPKKIDERLLEEIRKVFTMGGGIERIYFPTKSGQIPDSAQLKLIIISPGYPATDSHTLECIDKMTKESGSSARTFKNALIWAVADDINQLKDDTKKVLAWEEIKGEKDELGLDDTQKKQLDEHVGKAARDVKESVWRTYKKIAVLGKDNTIRVIDLGLVHSSSADSMVRLILDRLRNDGDITDDVSPNFLIRNWPPAFKEWSTRSVQNVFYASPLFPRLTHPERVKDAIVRGVTNGVFAYVGKAGNRYDPFLYKTSVSPLEIEISDDIFIITSQEAEEYLVRTRKPACLATLEILSHQSECKPNESFTFSVKGYDQYDQPIDVEAIAWEVNGGEIDDQGNFTSPGAAGVYQISARSGKICANTTISVREIYTHIPGEEFPIAEHGTYADEQVIWQGELTKQKWMSFFTKILKDIENDKGIRIHINFSITDNKAISPDRIREIEAAMREFGMDKK